MKNLQYDLIFFGVLILIVIVVGIVFNVYNQSEINKCEEQYDGCEELLCIQRARGITSKQDYNSCVLKEKQK